MDNDLNRIDNLNNRAVANGVRAHASQYHALPGNCQIQALVERDKMHPVLQTACLSNIELHHNVTDMTGEMTPEGRCILVCYCIKSVLSRHLKFFKKDLHEIYDQRTTSVCGLVKKSCNLSLPDVTLE